MDVTQTDDAPVVADLTAEEAAALELARDLRQRVGRERLAAQRLRELLALPWNPRR